MAKNEATTSLCSVIVDSRDDGEMGAKVCKREVDGDADSSLSFSATATPPLQSEESEVCARYLFNTRCQEAGESIDAFVAILSTLSSCCNFQQLRDGLIRDRVVVGVRSQATRERLLRHPELTLQSALDICREAEDESNRHGAAEEQGSQALGEKAVPKSEVSSPPDPQVSMETGTAVPCQLPGGDQHLAQEDRLTRMGRKGHKRKQTPPFSGGEGQDAGRRGEGGRGSYPCSDCGQDFQHQRSLLRHQERGCQGSGRAKQPTAVGVWAGGTGALHSSPGVRARRPAARIETHPPSQACVVAGGLEGDRGEDCDTVAGGGDKHRVCSPQENTRTWNDQGSQPRKTRTAKRIACDVCGKTFLYKRGLLNHRKRHTEEGDRHAHQDSGGLADSGDRTAVREHGSDLEACPPQDLGHLAVWNSSGHKVSRPTGGSSAHSDMEDETLAVGDCEDGDSSVVEREMLAGNSKPDGEKPLYCDLCGKGFGYPGNLVKHRARHVRSGDRYARRAGLVEGAAGEGGDFTGLGANTCRLCGKTFKKPRYLDRHLLTHAEERQFACEVCGKAFKTKEVLIGHQVCHTGREACTCSYCGRTFLKRAYLKKHERLHTGERPYECQQCGRRFHLSSGLHFHLLSHSGERPFKCDICGKGFDRRTNLKNHRITHSDSRPFSCSICIKSFRFKNELTRHELIHKGIKKFICHLCGAGFVSSSQLWQHMRHHHREEESKWRKSDNQPCVPKDPVSDTAVSPSPGVSAASPEQTATDLQTCQS